MNPFDYPLVYLPHLELCTKYEESSEYIFENENLPSLRFRDILYLDVQPHISFMEYTGNLDTHQHWIEKELLSLLKDNLLTDPYLKNYYKFSYFTSESVKTLMDFMSFLSRNGGQDFLNSSRAYDYDHYYLTFHRMNILTIGMNDNKRLIESFGDNSLEVIEILCNWFDRSANGASFIKKVNTIIDKHRHISNLRSKICSENYQYYMENFQNFTGHDKLVSMAYQIPGYLDEYE